MRGIAMTAIAALAVMSVQAGAAQTEPAEPEAEKKICKKQTEIGSLVKSKKICKTAKEWRADREAARSSTEEMRRSRLSGPNG